MRQADRATRRGRRGFVVGVVLAALALLATPPDALAQTFNDAIQDALVDNCSRLTGPFDSSLSSICSFGPSGTAGVSSGASIAAQTPRQQSLDERRIYLRLQEQREAAREGGVRAASADQSTQMGRLGIFMTGELEFVNKDVTRFEPGYDSDAKGLIFGADYAVLPWLTVGLALSYSMVHGDFDEGGGHFTNDIYGVTLYASVMPLPNLFVDATVGYVHRDYDTLRRATFFMPGNPLVDGFAQSNAQGNEFRMSAAAGYDFVLKALTVGPRVGVNYSTNSIDAYTERGRNGRDFDTGLELAYDRQHRDSLTTSVGAFLSYAVGTSIGVFVPQLTAEWVHEFLDDQRVVYFRFREDLGRTRLRFQTDPPDRDYFNLGVGVVLVLPKNVSAFVNYRTMVGYSDREVHTVSGGFRVNF